MENQAQLSLSAEQVVRAALGLACAHHETQLTRFQDVLSGKDPEQFSDLVDIYHQCAENNIDREDAFIELLSKLETA